ncbi:hypothetical protein [Bacillus cereus]|uniref:hypothetical protein n=1 Tax=Bacillus cereus TaxID=1396 RepID=UPI001C8CC659|nr:hypothetical protein [Bacillus cereus]MBX9158305.1 hypothetical protein [Bacillus cereus]
MCHEGVKLERKLFAEMLLQPLHKLDSYTYGEIEFFDANLDEFGSSCYAEGIPWTVFKKRYGIGMADVEKIRKDKNYIAARMEYAANRLMNYSKAKLKVETSLATDVIGVNLDIADRLLKKGYTCRQVCIALGVMYPNRHVNRIRGMVKRLYKNGEDVASKATWIMYLLRRGVQLSDIVRENEDVFPDVMECRRVLSKAGFTKARVNWLLSGTDGWSNGRIAV